jgi:hypothetical protein
MEIEEEFESEDEEKYRILGPAGIQASHYTASVPILSSLQHNISSSESIGNVNLEDEKTYQTNQYSKAFLTYLQNRGIDSSSMYTPYRKPLENTYFDASGSIQQNYIDIDIDDLEEELRCPVCLGQIEKTWTVMSCLHRFCSECLHRALRMDLGAKKSFHECPSCRSKIASRRSSNPDTTYDLLITTLTTPMHSHLITDTASVEDSQTVYDSQNSNSFNRSDIIKYREIHQKNINLFRLKQKDIRKRNREELVRLMNEKKPRTLAVSDGEEIISFSLVPWPSQQWPAISTTKCLPRPYLRVPGAIKISDIKAYLRMKSPWIAPSQLQDPSSISSSGQEDDIEVGIRSSSSEVSNHLVLFYAAKVLLPLLSRLLS